MANGQGGARIGAGRKKKALADNIADGNPGKRKLTVLDFTDCAADLEGQQMPPPKAFLAARQKNGKRSTYAQATARALAALRQSRPARPTNTSPPPPTAGTPW